MVATTPQVTPQATPQVGRVCYIRGGSLNVMWSWAAWMDTRPPCGCRTWICRPPWGG